ncbi:MAG: ImmA/IrrE family metallo-endopeptidase, partial [Acidobacteriota bacterium]|nr:ImmA/IrrE family metallo-endopeptidase [Acidobacteriota bacterium]
MRLSLAPLALVAIAAAAAETAPSNLCAQIPRLAAELQSVSGLPLRHPVPCDYIDKEHINQFLKKRVKEVAKPEDLRAEELTLKMFGLVPQDFDLAKDTVDLLTEQAAAFYDYDRKRLFITDTTPGATQESVLIHELAHAIADQNFHLARYIKQGRKNDDGSSARMAVMEGQATWLMSEVMARRLGQSLASSPGMLAAMSTIDDGAGGQYPVFDNSPLYLRMTLVFPYTKGTLFQNAVYGRDGKRSFAQVFLHPPISTQQILHPEKYFDGAKPTRPDLPDVHLGRGFKGLVGGSLGELEHEVMLEQYSGKQESARLAPHWRGCSFEL